jgi:hypothetical protein
MPGVDMHPDVRAERRQLDPLTPPRARGLTDQRSAASAARVGHERHEAIDLARGQPRALVLGVARLGAALLAARLLRAGTAALLRVGRRRARRGGRVRAQRLLPLGDERVEHADLFAQQRPFGRGNRQLGSQRRVFAERVVE